MWEDSDCVEILVNVLRDAFDLSVEFILDIEQVLLVIFGNEVDGHTQMTKSSGSADSMEIGLSVFWKIKVDDNVDSLDVDSSCKNIGTHKASGFSIFEIVKDPI